MKLKVRVLGCGSSGGVPQLGSQWGSCDAGESKNRRLRTSLLITSQDNTHILIDVSPDARVQLLDAGVTHLAAVFITHDHADHVHGIDDLRWIRPDPKIDAGGMGLLPMYADSEVCVLLHQRFGYIVRSPDEEGLDSDGLYQKRVQAIRIQGDIQPKGMPALRFQPIYQEHGPSRSVGFRVGDFAYNTDVSAFLPRQMEKLKGIHTWVIGCLREQPHVSHAHLAQVLKWVEQVGPKRVFFTHMNNAMDYHRLQQRLPEWISPAYDSLTFMIDPEDWSQEIRE